MMRILGVILSLTLISSFTIAAGQASKTSQKALKAKCLKAGGEWNTWSKYEASTNTKSCRIKATDAGKICGDGKECSTGLCEFDSKTKSGQCTQYSGGNGCHAWMENGQAGPTICVD